MNNKYSAVGSKQAGLTMIELMIAMVIGLILTAAVLQVFVGSRVTYSTQSSLAKLQENGRFAMEYITHDIRQTGYAGCAQGSTVVNVVDNGAGVSDTFDLDDALFALDNAVAGLSYAGQAVLPGSDVVMVKYAISGNTCTVSDHDSDAAVITCQAAHLFQRGEALVLSSCEHELTAVFQQTNANPGNNATTIEHKVDNSLTPGNCLKTLGEGTNCATNSAAPLTFNVGDTLLELASYRYFVANNAFGEPSLWREEISSVTVGGNVTLGSSARELVEGVEDMQILYGVDTNDDEQPEKYVNAVAVGGDIEDVIAVRVSLLMQSNEEGVVQGNQTLRFNGADRVFNDGRLRKVFTSTIALRNRM